jgi:ribosome-binding protein aMBF1 (putative translation factor)
MLCRRNRSSNQRQRLRGGPLEKSFVVVATCHRKGGAAETLGANVRRERTARQISQKELASRCGLNPRTIVKIEAGEIGIRPETLDRIERAISCTFNGAV